jgi:zinc transporter ZupT
MTEPLVFKALIVGVISACSLPMGAVTSFFWKPGDRTVAFLMAGGGGALLAALTIDLVGEALERGHVPAFRDRLKDFLKQTEVSDYLEARLHYDPDKASRWITSALDTLDHGKPLPAAQDVSQTVRAHGGAAMAIWLGILLDGIPESLVIGSSMLHSQISLSLIVGLFLSNFKGGSIIGFATLLGFLAAILSKSLEAPH